MSVGRPPTGDLLSGVWLQRAPLQLSSAEWQLLLVQARATRLQARLAWHCARHGGLEAVPAGPRRYLIGALAVARRQVQTVRWEVNEILKAMAGVDTPVVLLKGAAYVLADLPPAHGRLFADIDILVDRAALDAAEMALLVGGWVSDERDAYNNRYYRQWMHEIPPVRHVKRSTVIDVHHTVTPPTSVFNVDGRQLLARVQRLPGPRPVFALQPVDMVLHSAVHLFQEGEFDHGLRDLLDMNDLLQHFSEASPDFWGQLLARARELGLQAPLHHALFHLQRLFGTEPPPAWRAEVRALQPAWLPRQLMAWALTHALRPMHASCHQPGEGLARWLLYVRSHWLRMPVHLLLPHLVRKAWMRRFPDKPKQQPVTPPVA